MGEVVDGERGSGRAALGRTLRFLREKAGKTLAQLAAETSYDKSYLFRLEKGERLSKRAVMEDLDTYYDSGDLLVRLWKDTQREVIKDKYKAYMELEATARILWMFQLRVPGLLQTEDYARTVLSGLSRAQTTADNGEEFEEQVAARMGRQELLHRQPAPSVRVIMDVGAVRRPVRPASAAVDHPRRQALLSRPGHRAPRGPLPPRRQCGGVPTGVGGGGVGREQGRTRGRGGR
ncbi:helix-turn-helix domain-containing protein [Streptomyces sp. CA-210063]|nr:helix-turn-helix domain-containing protein [Streptomyces sp. CA-210063]